MSLNTSQWLNLQQINWTPTAEYFTNTADPVHSLHHQWQNSTAPERPTVTPLCVCVYICLGLPADWGRHPGFVSQWWVQVSVTSAHLSPQLSAVWLPWWQICVLCSGTVQMSGWTSWSHFQFLCGWWRRCREPWKVKERLTSDHVTSSPWVDWLLLFWFLLLFLQNSIKTSYDTCEAVFKNSCSIKTPHINSHWQSTWHHTLFTKLNQLNRCWIHQGRDITRSLPVCPWLRLWSVPPAERARWWGQWWRL